MQQVEIERAMAIEAADLPASRARPLDARPGTQKWALWYVLTITQPGKRWTIRELRPEVERVYGSTISECGLTARGRELHWQSAKVPGTRSTWHYWL